MRTVPINSERAYQVEIGIDWKIALTDWCEGRNKIVVITSKAFPVRSEYPTIEIPDGEAGKSAEVITDIWRQFGELGIDRNDLIIGIGGGAVTDLAGFAAATWLRGIDWIAIPTTLAGMVDAAIGGKTGINSEYGKNLVGAFHSPISVLIDRCWLDTLSERDIAAGMAEVIKCGFISDEEILNLLANKSIKDLCNDKELQLELIHRAVSVKAKIVSSDFRESHLREILNYGHTLGHAVEKHSDYLLRHGEAVAIGMCFVAQLAVIQNQLSEDVLSHHYQLLNNLKLPTSYHRAAWPELLEFMKRDKKTKSGALRFVALQAVGKCFRIDAPDLKDLEIAYERISS